MKLLVHYPKLSTLGIEDRSFPFKLLVSIVLRKKCSSVYFQIILSITILITRVSFTDLAVWESVPFPWYYSIPKAEWSLFHTEGEIVLHWGLSGSCISLLKHESTLSCRKRIVSKRHMISKDEGEQVVREWGRHKDYIYVYTWILKSHMKVDTLDI